MLYPAPDTMGSTVILLILLFILHQLTEHKVADASLTEQLRSIPSQKLSKITLLSDDWSMP